MWQRLRWSEQDQPLMGWNITDAFFYILVALSDGCSPVSWLNINR